MASMNTVDNLVKDSFNDLVKSTVNDIVTNSLLTLVSNSPVNTPVNTPSLMELYHENSSESYNSDIISDVDAVISYEQEIADINNKTLKERFEGNVVNTYGYLKYPPDVHSTKKGNTGRALSSHKTTNFAVVDIDINKKYSEERKEEIRNKFLQKLSEDDIIVKTGSGGLHIYCNTNDFYAHTNRWVHCIETPDYGIDLFNCVNDKQSFIMLPGSKVRRSGRDSVKTYNFLPNHGSVDSKVTRSIKDVLKDLDFTVTIPQSKDVQNIIDKHKNTNVSPEMVMALINGLEGLTIHNDGGRLLKDGISSFVLFQSINSLPVEYHEEAYENVYNKCDLTSKAHTNFTINRNRFANHVTSPFVLAKILKLYKEDYYINNVKKLLATHVEIKQIDFKDPFSLDQIRDKAENSKYNYVNEIVTDLSRIFRYIESGTIVFIQKVYDSDSKTFKLKNLFKNQLRDSLALTNAFPNAKVKQTLYDIMIAHLSKFKISGVEFYSENPTMLSLFNGYKYNILPDSQYDYKVIERYISFIKEVICDNDSEHTFNFILKWIAWIVQNPGKKAVTTLILKGLQGIGKNIFTDILSEMLDGYSETNLSDIAELTGQFNSVVEGRMLIVCNELQNAGENRYANLESLKTVISEKKIRINEKCEPRRTAQNVANFIMLTNNLRPVTIEPGTRRYCVLKVSGLHKDDDNYFRPLYQDNLNANFYDTLLTYFAKMDLTELNEEGQTVTFNVRKAPKTKAYIALMIATLSPCNRFVFENYNKLLEGMTCLEALDKKPIEKAELFKHFMNDVCTVKRLTRNKKRSNYYILNAECRDIYFQYVAEEDIEDEIVDEEEDANVAKMV